MGTNATLITAEGHAKIQADIADLQERLRKVRADKAEAVSETANAWHDNASYEIAQTEEHLLLQRIADLEGLLKRSTLVDPELASGDQVRLGSRVEIAFDEDDTMIVTIRGVGETNLNAGIISSSSPLGSAILGAREGDERRFSPGGKATDERPVKIVRIIRRPFIVLEGTSGTGKSTTAEVLARRLGGVVVKTPCPPFSDVREQFDRTFTTIEGRHLFYMAAVIESADLIRNQLSKTPVVCDRFVLTTQCYHAARGSKVSVDATALGLPQPDITVLLTCNDETRLRRLDDRGWSDNDREEHDLKITERFIEEYMKHEVFIVDTADKDTEAVVDLILDELRLRRNEPQLAV